MFWQLSFRFFRGEPRLPSKQTSNESVKPSVRRLPRAADSVELKAQWVEIRRRFFPDRSDLDSYTVCWSGRRQKRVLASCSYHRTRVVVASALDHSDYRHLLEPLLYHEMCHAYLGVPPKKNSRRQYHGAEFKALERLHPGIPVLDAFVKDGGWSRAVRRYSARTRIDRRD
jgi:hypothetical protein